MKLKFAGRSGVLLLSFWLSGCNLGAPAPTITAIPAPATTITAANTHTQTPEPTPIATATLEPTATATLEPTATLEIAAATILPSLAVFQKITSDRVGGLAWAPDTPTLFYTTLDPPSKYFWAYDSVENRVRALNVAPDIFATPQPSPDVLAQLPNNALGIRSSPSGDRVLYLIALEPTPEPVELSHSAGIASELWLWENGSTRMIGEFRTCSFHYAWTSDEQKVVVNHPTLPCGAAALIDLENSTIHLLEEDSPYIIVMQGISPDDTRLLYFGGSNSSLILDLETLESTPLRLPEAISYFGSWIDNQTLLVRYVERIENAGSEWTVGIFNLQTSEFTELVNTERILMLNGLSIREAIISADRRWLAFQTARDGLPDGLWVMQLDLDD